MIAVEPVPAPIETKRVDLLKAANATPARIAEVEAKLPPTLWKDYRTSWTSSLAEAKSNLVWIWSCTVCKGHTEDGKRSYWIDDQPASIVDKVIKTFVDVDRVCREVRNTADVTNRLLVEATLLKEASFARRESIKLRNELYQEDVVEVLQSAVLSRSHEVEGGDSPTGPCRVFERITTSLTAQSRCVSHNAKTVALEAKIFQQLARELDRMAWPHIVLPEEMAEGLGKKALAGVIYRKEMAGYDIQLRPINLRWILQQSTVDGVREIAYKDHMPVILSVGYKFSHAWLELRRQISANRENNSVGQDLVKGTPFGTLQELVNTCEYLCENTLSVLTEETAMMRRALPAAAKESSTALLQPWEQIYFLKEYEKTVKAKLKTEARIDCFDPFRTRSTLWDLAGGLLGCRFVLDPAFPGSPDQLNSFEVWRLYDTISDHASEREIGRIFVDWSTKRQTPSAKEHPRRHIEVMAPAPLGSDRVPQVLWSINSSSRLLPLGAVTSIAQDLGEVLDIIFRLSVDPFATVQPRSASDAEKADHAPAPITSAIMKLLARQPAALQKMLDPGAVSYDFVNRLTKTKHVAQVHETRDYMARLHGWAAVLQAVDQSSEISRETFQEIHAKTINAWGSTISHNSRLPQRLFHPATNGYINMGIKQGVKRPWLGPWIELRRGLKDVGATLIAAQVVERLIPCGIREEETVFDQDVAKAYRAYLETPIDLANPEEGYTKHFDSLGEKMSGKAFVKTLEKDLAAFKEDDKVQEEEDPRFKALRPLIIRIVQKRVINAKAKAVRAKEQEGEAENANDNE